MFVATARELRASRPGWRRWYVVIYYRPESKDGEDVRMEFSCRMPREYWFREHALVAAREYVRTFGGRYSVDCWTGMPASLLDGERQVEEGAGCHA